MIKKYILFGIILLGLLISIACSQQKVQVENKYKVQAPIEDIGFSCNSDEECILKPNPYCCGDSLEYIDSCYHINEESEEKLDCDSNNPCPSFALVVDCKCENNECVDVY